MVNLILVCYYILIVVSYSYWRTLYILATRKHFEVHDAFKFLLGYDCWGSINSNIEDMKFKMVSLNYTSIVIFRKFNIFFLHDKNGCFMELYLL